MRRATFALVLLLLSASARAGDAPAAARVDAPGPPPPLAPAAPQQNPAAAAARARPLRVLVLTTTDEAARTAAMACADAFDHSHPDVARSGCATAIAKDPNLALAHLWLSQAAVSADVATAELDTAARLVAAASRGEQLFVAGWRAWSAGLDAEAATAYNELCVTLPDEPRAFAVRGRFRQSTIGDLPGAVADFEFAARLDPKFAAAHNLLGRALVLQGKLDAAREAFKRYVELAPSEPNAHDALALVALRSGDAAGAVAEARRALALDDAFLPAHVALGDALLAQGKPPAARKEYERLAGAADPALLHDALMRSARSFLFEEKSIDAERALVREGDRARKASRPFDAAEAFVEAARAQLERGALAEAGRGIQEAERSLPAASAAGDGASRRASREASHARDAIEEARALALAALRERGLAVERLDALARRTASPDRVSSLKALALARAGDDKEAMAALESASLPTARLAYAQLLLKAGDKTKARPVLEALARRMGNDLETALTHARAVSALRNLGRDD